MNLIQQLQATPKWEDFEQWYWKQNNYLSWFRFIQTNLSFEFQKGVFEKFISKDATDITVDGYLGKETYSLILNKSEWKWFNSFEELLIWYFNN